jgi:hypothetical protein
VYQTGTASMLVEQGLMTFSAVQIRVHAALEQELQKVFRLNSLYLDEEQYFAFNDGQSDQEYTVYRSDFADDIQVRPSFDPHQLTERERKQNTMMEYEAALKSPVIMQSPEHLTNATRRFFTGIGAVNVSEIVPDAQQTMQAMQQRQQAAQGPAQAEAQQAKQEGQIAAVEAQASMVERQAKMAHEVEKLKQTDRKLGIEENKLVLAAQKEQREAGTAAKTLTIDTVRTAAEIEAMMIEAKKPNNG